MNDFDLRKFLAEQKAPKEENIKEETIEEVEVNEEKLDELRPGYAVGEMSPENNALLKALDDLTKKAGAAGKKIAAWAKDNIEVGKMSDAMKEGEVEETYHEGEDHSMEEGDLNEFSPEVVAVGAPLVMSLVASAIGKLGFDKFMQGLAKLPQLKGNKKFQDFVSKNASTFEEGEDHSMEEGKEKTEEELKESTFKASINDILNS